MDLKRKNKSNSPRCCEGLAFLHNSWVAWKKKGFHGNQLQLMIGGKWQNYPACEVVRGRQAQAQGRRF